MFSRVSIKEYFDTRLDALDKRFDDRDKNIELATDNLENRLKELNEVRKMTADWAERFADKTELTSRFHEVDGESKARNIQVTSKMEAIERELGTKIVNLEKYVSSLKGVLWVLSGTFLFLSIIVPILLKYLPVMLMRGP